MTHWRALLDPGIFLGPQDVTTDKTVQIARVVREKLPERDSDKEPQSAPCMYFSYNGKELTKRLKLPKSLMYGLSLMYGVDTDAWIGKDVTLFATKCMSFGDVEEAIRIRFPQDIDKKIIRWLKKRKSSPSCYMIQERQE